MVSKSDLVRTVKLDFAELKYTTKYNLFEIKYNSSCRIEVAHAKEMVTNICEMIDGRSALFLISASDEFIAMDTEAKKILAESQRNYNYSVASAFVTSILANRMAANFYIRYSKPPQPCKIFKNKLAALNWLNEFSSVDLTQIIY
jgi:hypothetical protein